MCNKSPAPFSAGALVHSDGPVHPAAQATRALLERYLSADSESLARLPAPVRIRACGVLGMWPNAMKLIGKEGHAVLSAMRDEAVPPPVVREAAISLLFRSLSIKGIDGRAQFQLAEFAGAMFWLIFWARNGALYEPTDALDALLGASDITTDLPLRMIRLPVKTMCIVPPVRYWNAPGGFEAVGLFEHEPLIGDLCAHRRGLTVVISRRAGRGHSMVFQLDGQSDVTLSQALEEQIDRQDNSAEHAQEIKVVLDYVFKVLLYLSLDDVQPVHERPHSMAPKTFTGLGKRKQEIRQMEVDSLYDRYLIGPMVLSDPLQSHTTNESGHTVRAHWRRGHFRMQAHGPQSSLRKVMFIMPTVVRGDRLDTGSP